MVDLLLPVWCPGCGRAGVSVCAGCARGLDHWYRAEFDADALPPGLPVWAGGAYVGATAAVLMAWKSGHRPDLAPAFARLGFHLGARVSQEIPTGSTVLVIPAPSGWRRRWRGLEVVAPVAAAVARGLEASGTPARMEPALGRRGGRNHHLSRQQRIEDRRGAVHLRRRYRRGSAGGGPEPEVLLVDDVLTTGATLAASAAAAEHLGPVLGAIVLTATPGPVQKDDQKMPYEPNF